MIVVFIIVDSLKAEIVGRPDGPAKIPTIDRLIEGGACFQNNYASGAWTIPSIISMLTGTLPHQVGVCRWRHPFPARRPTLLTAFAAAGFEVFSFVPYPRWGLLTVPGRGVVGDSQEPEAIAQAIRGRQGHDRFILIHYWWTHLPYLNRKLTQPTWHKTCDFALESLKRHPKRFAAKLEETYLKSVSYFSERWLPPLLEAAEAKGEKSLLVVTGDHGETWGRSWPAGRRVEHIYDLHGRWISDETIKVPLIICGQGAQGRIPARRCVEGFAGGVDLGPTLADLAGIPWPGPAPEDSGPSLVERNEGDLDITGQSMADSVMRGTPVPEHEVLTFSTQNTHTPRTYPGVGLEMWRTVALRTAQAWHIWDGVAKEETVVSEGALISAGEEDGGPHFDRLEALRRRAVDSAPIVEVPVADDLRENEEIKAKLRSVGYLD